MKKLCAGLLLAVALTNSVAALEVPTDTVVQNLNGSQQVVKTYVLSPDADPQALIEGPFELEGYRYVFADIVKAENYVEETKPHTETVTVETEKKDLDVVLEQLAPNMEYDDGNYSGVLALDHTSINTEAAGYTTQSYTISDTKQYTDLDRNDPSYIPTTSVKNGTTLTLSNLSWAVTGTGFSGESLVPTSYTATATYTAKASRKVATGYITTAKYIGEVTAQGISSIQYKVTYLGTPIEPLLLEPEPAETVMEGGVWPGFIWLGLIFGVILIAILVVVLYLRLLRPNAAIYAMNAKGVAYKKLGRQRLTARRPILDFTRLREYPAGEASVELQSTIAHKLVGRLITIQLYDGTRTHLVEAYDGDENYWFAVKEDDEKEALEV